MKRNDGFVLITALLIMVVVTILVFGTSFTSLIDRMVASNQRGANAAYYVAQAGLNQYKTLVFKNLVDYYEEHGQGWCASPISDGIKDEHGQVILPPGATTEPQPFGPGAYQVNLQMSDTFLILTSVGTVGNAQTALQLVATAGGGPAGVYDNAIFAAGTTPGSKAITGNIAVYGSIHIVSGSVELDQDAVDADLEFSGTAGVYNNYLGNNGQNNSGITDRVRSVTGSGNVDLCARLKIDRGNVFLQGNSRLGADGNPIYSVHLGNGKLYDGLPPASPNREIKNHDESSKVWLRYPADGKGVNSGYEGYELDLPRLAANYPNDVDGALNLANLQTHASCTWLFQGGKVKLPPANPSQNTPTCSNGTSSIKWHGGNPGHFEIQGNVNTGSLSLELGASQNSTLHYTGKGVLRAGSSPSDNSVSTTILGSLIPVPGFYGGTENGGYPENNVLGVVTSGNAHIRSTAGAGGSQVAAIVFSAGSLSIDRQPVVIGSLVARDFDMGAGNNVPKVAWHPGVRDAAEVLCLPGSFCAEGEVPPNPGILSDISIERRDTAAINQ